MNQYLIIDASINSVKDCIEKNSESNYRNVADTFFPIGAKGHELDWSWINKSIVESLYELSSTQSDWDALKITLRERLNEKRETRDLVSLIDELYLTPGTLNQITPLAYLLCSKESPSGRTPTMMNIFSSMLLRPLLKNDEVEYRGNNCLETLLIEEFHSHCEESSFIKKGTPYLPFLAEGFTKDLHALSGSSSWFIDEFENLTKLYAFLYLIQLTINLCVPHHRFRKPQSQPVYFILETESASKERHECHEYGYDYIFSTSRGLAYKTFPFLGYFDRISKAPCWDLPQFENNEFIAKVQELNSKISTLFNENEPLSDNSLIDSLNKGAELNYQIFINTSRKDVNKKVVGVFEKIYSAGLITNRKAAGKYFVLNSSTLLLLTNLVIGKGNKLLIDEVIDAFKERGIWLDVKSKKALLKFYENVGNIEKLSDSGDAVYVKSTV